MVIFTSQQLYIIFTRSLWGILYMAGISLFVFLILAACAWFNEREEYTHIRYLIRSEVALFILLADGGVMWIMGIF